MSLNAFSTAKCGSAINTMSASFAATEGSPEILSGSTSKEKFPSQSLHFNTFENFSGLLVKRDTLKVSYEMETFS